MSNIIYVVPWAICHTDEIYIKKVNSDLVPAPEKGAAIDDWCIRNVMASPDRRTKDVYAVVDVYNGYKEKLNEKGMSVFSLNNSEEKLKELGYEVANEAEVAFIRQKILKIDKPAKGKKSK
ncbi:MAG: hypothetical protein E7259_06530 [Lachnospiraceae bacterium]|nr:hypothetical protein [Lachnospiraceae bacterium]